MGKPVVVKTKLLKNMVLREFYELVAATEVISCNYQTHIYKLVACINKCNLYDVTIFSIGKQRASIGKGHC